jgi:hypothetical protein
MPEREDNLNHPELSGIPLVTTRMEEEYEWKEPSAVQARLLQWY